MRLTDRLSRWTGFSRCRFEHKENTWDFSIKATDFLPYEEKHRRDLSQLGNASGIELIKAHADYGTWLGEQVSYLLEIVES